MVKSHALGRSRRRPRSRHYAGATHIAHRDYQGRPIIASLSPLAVAGVKKKPPTLSRGERFFWSTWGQEALFAAVSAFAAFFAFLALNGRNRIGRGSDFFFSLYRRRSNDRGDREVFVHVGRIAAFRKVHRTHVDGIADFQPVERDVNFIRDVGRVADKFGLVLDDV